VAAWACRGATFSAFSPSFFLERSVWVLALAAFCEWNSHRPAPAIALHAGKHSLKLYVTHLALITALAGIGVPSATMAWPQTVALLIAVLVVSFGASHFLDRLPQFLRDIRATGAAPARDLASPAS